MARPSIGQKKILDRFKRLMGARLALDPETGRYTFFHAEDKIQVDQRPVETMLRSGLLVKDAVGRCYPSKHCPHDTGDSMRI